ncbi:general secretion pathway protein H [Bordetella ansorpii]|uniref:Type II secretion system protein H n=2 Tax=Bordetella ansorpii TaxID=288768 RepID=A0A157QMR3_9BORD|nr:general secretion pathway protein H [Bordetella ansorpii]
MSTRSRNPPIGAAGERGFSLIEIMVVLVIVGIATATVTFSISPDESKVLRRDALRLAQLFDIAQTEVRTDGRAIVWQADEKGYRFARASWIERPNVVIPTASTQVLDTFARDNELRPRQWEARMRRVDAKGPIVLTDEWVGPPWEVRLSDGDHVVIVRREASGRFVVVSP